MRPPGQNIVAFRPSKARDTESDQTFTGSLSDHDQFSAWAVEKCSPMVREITFENAEELTEEGLPFLILFHGPDDTESIKEYNDLVSRVSMTCMYVNHRSGQYIQAKHFVVQLLCNQYFCHIPTQPDR